MKRTTHPSAALAAITAAVLALAACSPRNDTATSGSASPSGDGTSSSTTTGAANTATQGGSGSPGMGSPNGTSGNMAGGSSDNSTATSTSGTTSASTGDAVTPNASTSTATTGTAASPDQTISQSPTSAGNTAGSGGSGLGSAGGQTATGSGAGAGSGGTTGANSAATAATPTTATSTGQAAKADLARGDRKFLNEAAESGLFEVEVARLAAEKALDPQVKSFAQRLVDDHTKANDQLKTLASNLGAQIPGVMPSGKRRDLDKLAKKTGADFDKSFVEMVGLKDHKADIKLFEKASKDAKNDQIKSFAATQLPVLKEHHAMAERLPKAVGGKG